MKLIVAVNNKGYIGLKDEIPWRSSEDLKHFKNLTLNTKVLVGRKTFEHLPTLKNREFLIISNKKSEVYNTFSLEEGLKLQPDWVIGGAQIYQQTYHLCDEIHLSHINDETIGDTKFEIPEDYQGKIFHYYFETNKIK